MLNFLFICWNMACAQLNIWLNKVLHLSGMMWLLWFKKTYLQVISFPLHTLLTIGRNIFEFSIYLGKSGLANVQLNVGWLISVKVCFDLDKLGRSSYLHLFMQWPNYWWWIRGWNILICTYLISTTSKQCHGLLLTSCTDGTYIQKQKAVFTRAQKK